MTKRLIISVLCLSVLVLATASLSNAACTVPVNGVLDPTSACSPKATCNGTADDSTVLVAAMTALNNKGGGALVLPAGKICVSNSTLSITSNGISIGCQQGNAACGLRTTSASIPQVTVAGGLYYATIKDITFWRQAIPTSTAVAIQFLDTAWWSNIENVTIQGGYNGVILAAAQDSHVTKLNITATTSDGLLMQPTSSYDCEFLWTLDSVTVQNSTNGYGIRLAPGSGCQGPSPVLAPWNKLYTDANYKGSIFVEMGGVNDLLITNSRFRGVGGGTSLTDEVTINVNGGIGGAIRNSTVEIATGNGIAINGTDGAYEEFVITGTDVYNAQKNGISATNVQLTMSGVKTEWNPQNGVLITGAAAKIAGLTSINNGQYGVKTTTDDLHISGGDLTRNPGAVSAPSLTLSQICAVKGIIGYCR